MQARGQKGCFVPFVSFFLYGTARSKGQVTCNAGGGIFLLLRSTAKKPLPSYGPERASGREWGKVRNRKCWVKRRGKCPSQGSSSGGTWATNIAVQTNMEDPVGCSESLQSPAGCQSAVDCLCTKSHVGRAASPLRSVKTSLCMVKPERSRRGWAWSWIPQIRSVIYKNHLLTM